MSSVANANTAKEWPADGLEQVSDCPACGSPQRERELSELRDWAFGAAPGTWNLQRCSRCRAVYLDPRPNRESIQLAYSNYFTHAAPATSSLRSITSLRQLRQWLVRAAENGRRNRLFGTRFRPAIAPSRVASQLLRATFDHVKDEARGLESLPATGRVLDVGCGSGEFLSLAQEMGWSCYGVEMDPAAARVARERGATIVAPVVEQLDASHDAMFAAVTLSHVIEHVHDPIETLRHCWRVLEPGGYLWIETPNVDSAGYATFGRFWRGLEAPRHLVIFNAGSLTQALRQVGFDRVEVLPPRDVIRHMFTRSTMMQQGRIADVDFRPLSAPDRARAEAEMTRARAAVSQDAQTAEFITLMARRPD